MNRRTVTLLFSSRGQSVLEYTLLVVAIVGALACLFNYVKRGVQGRFKMGADTISERQYEPGKTIIVGR